MLKAADNTARVHGDDFQLYLICAPHEFGDVTIFDSDLDLMAHSVRVPACMTPPAGTAIAQGSDDSALAKCINPYRRTCLASKRRMEVAGLRVVGSIRKQAEHQTTYSC